MKAIVVLAAFIGIINSNGAWAQSPSPEVATTNTTDIFVVCAAPMAPVVYCNDTTAPGNYSGYDVELFRLAAQEPPLNWVEGVDYEFKCTPFNTMLQELQNPNGTCNVGIGGITITVAREQSGIQFSYPTYNTGLGIMVRTSSPRGQGWAWVSPFTWDLWLGIGITVLVFPALVFLIEFGSLKKRIYASDLVPGLEASTTRTLRTLMAQEPLEVSSFGAKVATLVFLFMTLILVNTYTANLAAALTVNRINSQINSVEELRGKAVATNAIYMPRLRARYGILAVELVPTADFVVQAAQEVMAGNLAAVITDAPLILAALQQIPGCQVMMLAQVIEPFSSGWGFKNGTNQTIIDEFSNAILTLQEQGDVERLMLLYMSAENINQCGNELSNGGYSIDFMSLYGLWVILGASIVAGFGFMLLARWMRKRRKNKAKVLQKKGITSQAGAGDGTPMPRRDVVGLGEVTAEDVEAGGITRMIGGATVGHGNTAADIADGSETVSNGRHPPVSASKLNKAQMEQLRHEQALSQWRHAAARMSVLQKDENMFGEVAPWQSGDDIRLQSSGGMYNIEEGEEEEPEKLQPRWTGQ